MNNTDNIDTPIKEIDSILDDAKLVDENIEMLEYDNSKNFEHNILELHKEMLLIIDKLNHLKNELNHLHKLEEKCRCNDFGIDEFTSDENFISENNINETNEYINNYNKIKKINSCINCLKSISNDKHKLHVDKYENKIYKKIKELENIKNSIEDDIYVKKRQHMRYINLQM